MATEHTKADGSTTKHAVPWHEGFRVSSEEFPTHGEGSAIWVPARVMRRYQRELRGIFRRVSLPEEDPECLSREEADLITNEWILKIGIRWNWVDHETNLPLPQPGEDPEVLERISEDEVVFIVAHAFDGTAIPPPNSTVS